MKSWIAFVLMFALAGGPLYANPGGKDQGKGHGKEGGMAKALNLSAEQKEKVKTIRTSGREAVKALRESMKTARKALFEAMKEPKRGAEYQKVLLEKFGEVQKLKQQMELQRFQTMLAIREILTDSQLGDLKAFGHEGRGRRGKRGEPSAAGPDESSDEE